MNCKYCGAELYRQEKFCTNCGKENTWEEEQYEPMPEPEVTGRPDGMWKLIVIFVLLTLFVLTAILAIAGCVSGQQLREQLAEKDTQILQQQAEIDDMEEKCKDYDAICALNNANIGYISKEFHVTKGLVVLKKSDVGKQITLTTKWYGYASIGVNYTGTSARLEFDNNQWKGSTTMTIVPYHTGTTVAEFYNTLNSERFKVVLVVVE